MRLFTLTLATTVVIGTPMTIIGGQVADKFAQDLAAKQQQRAAAIEALLN